MFGREKRRSYSILLAIDYTNQSAVWQRDIDTIRYNLLGAKKTADSSWNKIENLPSILVSTVDIVETKESALTALREKKYDVVICNRRLNGNSIMAGTLKKFRAENGDALYISLLNYTQRRGSRLNRDNGTFSINDGEGVRRLFDSGFYSALWQDRNFSLEELINLILSNGRSKEEAYHFYGLDITDEQILALEQGQDIADINKHPVMVEDVAVKTENVTVAEPLEETVTPISSVSTYSSSSQPVEPMPEPERKSVQDRNVETDETDYSQKLHEQARKGQQIAENMNEKKQTGITMTGMLSARVVYGQGNTIVLNTDVPIEEMGIELADLLGMPASIMYLKR